MHVGQQQATIAVTVKMQMESQTAIIWSGALCLTVLSLYPCQRRLGTMLCLCLSPPILKPQTVNPKLQTLGKHLLVELGTVMGPLSLRTKPNIFHKSHSSGLALAPERQLWLQRIGLPATLPLITARGEVIFDQQAAHC